jgi:hypothetical protein
VEGSKTFSPSRGLHLQKHSFNDCRAVQARTVINIRTPGAAMARGSAHQTTSPSLRAMVDFESPNRGVNPILFSRTSENCDAPD